MSNSNWFMSEIKKFSLGSTEPSKNTSPEFEKKFMAFQIKWLENCVKELNESQQWQPIETAPKDGKRILVFCSHSNMTIETCWLENSGFGWWWNTHHLNPPTHWMPLPKPPKNNE
jgi:hypothetical protein